MIICLSHILYIHGCKFDFQLKISINLTKYRQMLERKSTKMGLKLTRYMYLSHSLSIVWIQKTVGYRKLLQGLN